MYTSLAKQIRLLSCSRYTTHIKRLRHSKVNLTSNFSHSVNSQTANKLLLNEISRKSLLKTGIRSLGAWRHFSTSRNPSNGSDEDNPNAHNPEDDQGFGSQLPATVAVPEVWPHLPVIAINRNIVFPRFIKLIEVGFLWTIDHHSRFCFC